MSTRAPLGSKPMKLPGPAKVARARQRTATPSPSATVSTTVKRQSGKASKSSAKKAAIRRGPGAQDAVDVRLRVGGVVALLGVAFGAAERPEVLARDAGGLGRLIDVGGHGRSSSSGLRAPLYA